MNASQMGAEAGESKRVSYPYFVAFISLLANIELVKKIYLNATSGSRTMEITKGMYRTVRIGRLGNRSRSLTAFSVIRSLFRTIDTSNMTKNVND